MKILDFFCDLVFCCVSLSIISMFSYLAVVRYHILQILIEQSNSGSLANGANYHPPKTLPRSEVWASTVCASSMQPCVLQKMGQRCVTSTYLSSIPSVARCVHQRKMAHFKCLGVCVSNPGTQRGGLFPGGVQAGLPVLTSAVCGAVGVRGVSARRDLPPLGRCQVLRAQEVVTTKGSVAGVGSPRRWPVSFGGGFGPVATVSWGV